MGRRIISPRLGSSCFTARLNLAAYHTSYQPPHDIDWFLLFIIKLYFTSADNHSSSYCNKYNDKNVRRFQTYTSAVTCRHHAEIFL
ncbi:hypothetical protein PBPRA3374 [Photobacterium profundum SS9]|uniref:Uncharacterized protein n=1 Tax=Photobacterium profundum (strain SS9) TaxID=298386 RepID=Q6LM19_PHOPR|nr:hypothetical protein PBPRA3374 [Photobacterium profundum SS9]